MCYPHLQNIVDEVGSIVLGKMPFSRLGLGNDSIEQLTACTELSNQMQILRVLEDVNQLKDS